MPPDKVWPRAQGSGPQLAMRLVLFGAIVAAQEARLDAYAAPRPVRDPGFRSKPAVAERELAPPPLDWADALEPTAVRGPGSTSQFRTSTGAFAGPTNFAVHSPSSDGHIQPVQYAPHRPHAADSAEVDPDAARTHTIWHVSARSRRLGSRRGAPSAVDWADEGDGLAVRGPGPRGAAAWDDRLPARQLDWPEPPAPVRPERAYPRVTSLRAPWTPRRSRASGGGAAARPAEDARPGEAAAAAAAAAAVVEDRSGVANWPNEEAEWGPAPREPVAAPVAPASSAADAQPARAEPAAAEAVAGAGAAAPRPCPGSPVDEWGEAPPCGA